MRPATFSTQVSSAEVSSVEKVEKAARVCALREEVPSAEPFERFSFRACMLTKTFPEHRSSLSRGPASDPGSPVRISYLSWKLPSD